MLILPVALLSMTLFQIQYQLLIKSNNFKAISGGVFFGSVASNSLKVLLGVLFPAAITLVVVTALSNLFGWIALKYKSGIYQSGFGVFLGWKKLKSITIKYKDFPIFRAPQDLINAFSQSLPVVLLGMYFGVEAAGFYALAKLIIGAPSQLIGKAVGDVFYPKITQAFNVGGDAYQLLVKATKILIILGVFPLLLISFFGQEIFKYLFGDGWYQAGIYAQWLSVFYFFNLINK
jgi:O-antigen/teichoic acid export membrane protein